MNAKITSVELVDLMAQATSSGKRVCELFLRELFAVISQALIDGESVKVKGIGTFKITRMKPRKSVDVNTGMANEVASYNKLTFTPDKAFADAVNQPFAQFETVVLDDEVTDEKLAEIDEQYPSLFDDMTSMPEPPDDMPEPPAPSIEDLLGQPAEPVAEKPVQRPAEPVKEESKAEQHVMPAMATPIEDPEIRARRLASTPLMGIPIDGPSEPEEAEEPEEESEEPIQPEEPVQPVEEPVQPEQPEQPVEEPEPEDDFHRPAPRNAYTPTPEQIEKINKPDRKRWLLWSLAAAGAVVAGVLLWMWLSPGGNSDKPDQETVIAAADTVPDSVEVAEEAAPPVVTDIVTSQIVLSTLSEKYYGSPWFWVYIYEENRSIISDPNNVKPGTSVVIPPAEKYGIDAKDPASLKKAQRRSWEILKGK